MGKNNGSVEWRGALNVVGFNVNVALYKPTKKTRNESFKLLGPDGQAVHQVYVDDAGEIFKRADLGRGVEIAKDTFRALPPEALEAIESGTKTEIVEPAFFVKRGQIDMTKAIATYAVRGDDRVPGAGSAVNVLWNGLLARDLACCSTFSKRGAMDSVIALWADGRGLWATEMPFEDEVYPQPDSQFSIDDRAAAVFSQVIDRAYEIETDFDWARFKSEYKTRRMTAIEAVLKGEPVPTVNVMKPAPAVNDMLAALERTLESGDA